MAKALVAYFSASGVTRAVAARLTESIGADLYEIAPAVPYTKPDLDWQNRRSRSTLEMSDRASRPAIGTKVEHMEQYDMVFVGFPVWWYREPSIIDTFMESYDFSGKTVVPFATSGSSGIGSSGANMNKLAPQARVATGQRFDANVSADTIAAWAQTWL